MLLLISAPPSRSTGHVVFRFFPHLASITFRMIFFRSAAVVPAQRTAWARPAAAFPPQRPSDTAAGSFLFFLAIEGDLIIRAADARDGLGGP